MKYEEYYKELTHVIYKVLDKFKGLKTDKEEIKERKKKYYQDNKEEIKKYYQEHKEEIKEKSKLYREKKKSEK